jgi:imidazoleglycerol phosphate dehydratase HisB
MGWETANVHLGTLSERKSILRHLKTQKGKWLHHAAEVMLQAVRSDWSVWKKKGFA